MNYSSIKLLFKNRSRTEYALVALRRDVIDGICASIPVCLPYVSVFFLFSNSDSIATRLAERII